MPHRLTPVSSRRLRLSYSQVPFHDFLVQAGDETVSDDAATIHDVNGVCHIDSEVKILLHQQNADTAFALKLQQGLADLIDDVGLNAFRRFIEDQKLRLC